MAIVLKGTTFSENGSDLSVPVGMAVTISCPACGHTEAQNGRGKMVAACAKCGSTKDLRIEIGAGVVLSANNTNVFENCGSEK